jgi:two-component system, NarL family, sensor histidine kinase UhpB
MDVRQHLYLLVKEAINNAVKYSHASLLQLDLQLKDGKVQVSITDNGEGFDTTLHTNSNGMINMQRRADEMGAVFSVCSVKGKGTRVELEAKITH